MIETKVFEICNHNDLVYLKIPSFNKTGLVNHCFSTRLGGVSSGIFESMNLGFKRGDNIQNVKRNFEILCNANDINVSDLVFTDQVHEDSILVVHEKDRGKGFDKSSDIKGIDGIITQAKKVALTTFYADCVPLYFLDPVNKVIGLSHAGWRGTVKKIGAKTVNRMKDTFGSNPEDILVAIGPSIGPCCFEVSEDVKLAFDKAFNHDIIDKIVKKHNNDKYLIDLWTANKQVLLEAGLKVKNITMTDLCTMCNKDVLFSHRASNGQRGSLAAIMELK